MWAGCVDRSGKSCRCGKKNPRCHDVISLVLKMSWCHHFSEILKMFCLKNGVRQPPKFTEVSLYQLMNVFVLARAALALWIRRTLIWKHVHLLWLDTVVVLQYCNEGSRVLNDFIMRLERILEDECEDQKRQSWTFPVQVSGKCFGSWF